MKKIFILTVTIVLSFSVLVACSVSPQGSYSDSVMQSSSGNTFNEKIEINFNVVNEFPDNSADNSIESSDVFSSDDSSVSDEGDTSGGYVPVPEGDVKKVLKNIRSTVVGVKAYVIDEASETVVSVNQGSGVIIANSEKPEKSYIVTSHHIIDKADGVDIETLDGEVYPAEFIGSDPDSNLCVMSIDKLLPTSVVYNGGDIEPGEAVFAIGYPIGNSGGTVTAGIVSANDEISIEGKKRRYLQTDAAVNSGNSGGGLFTETGYLIGIVDYKYGEDFMKDIKGVGLAVPSDTMLHVTSELVRTHTPDSPGYIEGKYNFGFTVNDYYSSKWATKSYVYIQSLDKSGCFFKAGMQVDDRIISLEYKQSTYLITDAKSFLEYMYSTEFSIGDTITFKIMRKERESTIQVTVLQYIYGLS